jgi:hypothetical protein
MKPDFSKLMSGINSSLSSLDTLRMGANKPPLQLPGQQNTMQPSVMPGGTALGGTGAQPGMAVPGMAGATAQAGGTSTQQAIMNNPAALEQYWQQNPQALRQAIGGNPGMFAPAGLQRDSNTAPPTGLIGSEQAQYGGLLAGMGQLNDGMAGAEAAYDKYGQQATDTMDAYYQPGVGANNQQAALSGALGPEAQKAAYAQFMESPGQAYLKEQSEKAGISKGALRRYVCALEKGALDSLDAEASDLANLLETRA